MTTIPSHSRSVLFAAIAAGLIAAAPVMAQQPANPAPGAPPTPAGPSAPTAQTPATPAQGSAAQAPAAPPPWAQGRPDNPAVADIAPVQPPPIPTAADKLPLAMFKLPPNFHIEVYAPGVANARSLRVDDKGNVFVSTRQLDRVYALTDKNGKREVKTLATGLNSPNGIAFSNGTLYVAERERILRYDNIEDHLDNPSEPKVVVDGLPHQDGHFWKFMVMGPDGWLYFNQGAPTNITMPNYIQAAILRVQPDKHLLEVYAQGVRNSVGMAFSPVTKQLWFTDNGRDWLGEDTPSDELDHATAKGENFGYPFCHQGDTLDPVYGKYASCADFVPPDVKLGPHVASLGMRFYTGKMFPADWKNNIIIAEHGSWNRTEKSGYNLTRVILDPTGTKVEKSEPFATGFLDGQNILARPVDVQVMPDGSLLVSDDWNGAIYRISYKKT